MKKLFYLAAALLAAAACSREPVIPEDPEGPIVEQSGPIEVTLVAGNPETRTEVFNDGGLKPYWSDGDNISLVRVPSNGEEFEYDDDEEDYVYHPFEGLLIDPDSQNNRSSYAKFTGQLNSGGQYRAFYPEYAVVEDEDGWMCHVSPYWDADWDSPALIFEIPTVQYPKKHSFDPSADFLVSNPFTISVSAPEENKTLGVSPDIPISFTRLNAIVKINFIPGDNKIGEMLSGEKVRRVVFGEYWGEGRSAAPRTRAGFYDNDDYTHGLTGNVRYSIPYIENLDDPGVEYDLNEDAIFLDYCANYPFVIAEYSNDTAFGIFSDEDPDAATYLVVVPSIMKNDDEGGLSVIVETDRHVIRREINLPANGIALQPSVVTTLNIKLFEEDAEDRGIAFDKSETTLIPGDGEYVDLKAMAVTLPWDIYSAEEFEEYFTVNSPTGISLRYVEYGDVGDYGTDVGYEGISNLYLSVDDDEMDPGDYDVTITYEGCTATCTVHVININSSPFISFEDDDVRDICAEHWGGRRETGKITYYEASKVTTLSSPENYKSYFYGNAEITSFNELQYFTGLTSLEQDAFDSCINLQSVKLPKSLIKIDYGYYNSGAFRNCGNLLSVDFSECTDLQFIGSYAFSGCTKLTSITLPASVGFISDHAFYSCQALTTVAFKENPQLSDIHEHAFDYCLNLSTITLPSSLETIGNYAFSDCRALASINIPESVTSIGNYAFNNCFSLNEVTVQGQGSFSIGEGAFEYSGLTNIDNLLQHATSFGSKAFDHSAVQSVVIPSGITTIPSLFLSYCEALESVTFAAPSRVETIDSGAFRDCTSLRSIEFPSSLTTINSNVFINVTFRSGNGETGVMFNGTNPPSTFNSAINGEHWDGSDWVSGVEIRVPSGSAALYQNVSNITNNGQNTIVEF